MNIKQKLILAFAVIASLPVMLVAVLIILNVRHEARDGFIDSSGREIRQVDNAMQLFFEGISQNVSYLAAQQLRECHRSLGGNGRSRRATARSGGYGLDGVS